MNLDDGTKLIARSMRRFLSGTFLSRMSGMARDMAMAYVFGSSGAIASFMVAFRFANLFRRLFGESSLASSFIPHFEEERSKGEGKAAEFFVNLYYSLGFFLIFWICMLELALFFLMKSSFLTHGAKEIIHLTMLMLPGLFFICLFALSTALLQCEKRFFLSGVAPLAFNVVWVVAVLISRRFETSTAINFIAIAVNVAFLAQWLFVAPRSFWVMKHHLTWKSLVKPVLFSLEVRRLLKPFFLGVIGVGAMQINSALDAVFAKMASEEGPAFLWYAIRLQQLPLALFGVALSSALLPPLSRAVKNEAFDQFHRMLVYALRKCFIFIIPASFGLLVGGFSLIYLIFARGNFDMHSTVHTYLCLVSYALGILPSVLVLLFAPAFYAQKDYKTPTKFAVYAVVANALLNALFVNIFHWGAYSIAVATGIASMANAWFLGRELNKRFGALFEFSIWRSFFKITAISSIAAAITLTSVYFLWNDPSLLVLLGRGQVIENRGFIVEAGRFCVNSLLFGLSFLTLGYCFKLEELMQLVSRKNKELA